jgi:hypothetical protein
MIFDHSVQLVNQHGPNARYTNGGTAISGGEQHPPLPFFLDDVICTGSEWSPLQCTHNGISNSNCNNGEMYRVSCIPNTNPPTYAPTQRPSPIPTSAPTSPAPTQMPTYTPITSIGASESNAEFMLYCTDSGFTQTFRYNEPNGEAVRTYAIYEVQMTSLQEFTFDTCGSRGDTVLYLMSGTQVLATNDNWGSCGYGSRLTYKVSLGARHRL